MRFYENEEKLSSWKLAYETSPASW